MCRCFYQMYVTLICLSDVYRWGRCQLGRREPFQSPGILCCCKKMLNELTVYLKSLLLFFLCCVKLLWIAHMTRTNVKKISFVANKYQTVFVETIHQFVWINVLLNFHDCFNALYKTHYHFCMAPFKFRGNQALYYKFLSVHFLGTGFAWQYFNYIDFPLCEVDHNILKYFIFYSIQEFYQQNYVEVEFLTNEVLLNPVFLICLIRPNKIYNNQTSRNQFQYLFTSLLVTMVFVISYRLEKSDSSFTMIIYENLLSLSSVWKKLLLYQLFDGT